MKVSDIPVIECDTIRDMPQQDYRSYTDSLEIAVHKYAGRYGVYPPVIYRWAWYVYLPVPEMEALPLFAASSLTISE